MSYYVSVKAEADGPISIRLHDDWDECQKAVGGVPAAFGKKFFTAEAAEIFSEQLRQKWITWQQIIRANQVPTAYVDGGCKVKEKVASWGLCVMSPSGDVLHEDYGIVGDNNSVINIARDQYDKQRQVAGELYAATKAVEWATKNGEHIILACDYIGILYHANDIWPPKTPLQNWYKAKMNDPGNYIQSWRWIRGHSGVPGNEKADQLAAKAITEFMENERQREETDLSGDSAETAPSS